MEDILTGEERNSGSNSTKIWTGPSNCNNYFKTQPISVLAWKSSVWIL